MQTPATTSATSAVVTPRHEVVRSLVVASGPALGIFLASRLLVLALFSLVAKARHQTVGHYLTRWDSHWYIQIARHGYAHAIPRGHGNIAQVNLGFFPLLPMLIRITHWITRVSFPASGELVSFLAGALAAVSRLGPVRQRQHSVARARHGRRRDGASRCAPHVLLLPVLSRSPVRCLAGRPLRCPSHQHPNDRRMSVMAEDRRPGDTDMHRRQRTKNLFMFFILLAVAAVFFGITVVKMGAQTGMKL